MLARQAGGSRRSLLTGTSAASFRISIISSKRAKVNTVTARGRIQSNYRARPGSLGAGPVPPWAPGPLPLLKVWASRSHRSELGLWPRSGHSGLTPQGAPTAQVADFGPRGSLSRVRKFSPRPDPTSHSGLLWSARGRRALASSVPRKLPASPQRGPAPPAGVSASVNLTVSWARAAIPHRCT